MVTNRLVVAVLACVGLGAPGSGLAGDVYALLIGVDEYEHIGNLGGAVNDARDVLDAVEGLGARDVRLLLDREATREAIFAAWRELTGLAGERDTLIFHYAGHGGRHDAILEGHEAKDNVFLLSGFSETGPGVTERIVDNEIGHLLAQEREATVVFVADSCFAGGMTRPGDPRAPVDIRAPVGEFEGSRDAVADRVRQLGEVDENALSGVIWLYAQDANKVTQEIAIGGRRRGALSYTFARALRGDADRNDDGRLEVSELKRYVNRTVGKVSEGRQRPEVNAGSSGLSIGIAGDAAARALELPELRIFHIHGGSRVDLRGVAEVDDRRTADIIFDAVDRALIYRTGDVVARFDASAGHASLAAGLQGAVDKWRLIPMLAEFDSDRDPELSLAGGDRVYLEGEEVEFSILSRRHRHVALFSLAYDGTVQLVAPVERTGDGILAGRLPIGRRMSFRSPVIPPFGADHLVAITTPDDLPGLDEAVRANDGKRNAVELAGRLAEILAGREFGMDWIGIYTQARGDGT